MNEIFNVNKIKIVEFTQESVFMRRKSCAEIESESNYCGQMKLTQVSSLLMLILFDHNNCVYR